MSDEQKTGGIEYERSKSTNDPASSEPDLINPDDVNVITKRR
jgi:hypothetical protein